MLIGTPLRADCLAKGECDAAPLVQPYDIVFMSKGYGKLGDTLEVVSVLQFSVIAARRAWASAQSRPAQQGAEGRAGRGQPFDAPPW